MAIKLKYSSFILDHSAIENAKHKFDKFVSDSLDTEIHDILFKKKVISLSHTNDDAKVMHVSNLDEFPLYLNMEKGLEYKRRTNVFKRTLHWPQMKLFLSELHFLNRVSRDAQKIPVRRDLLKEFDQIDLKEVSCDTSETNTPLTPPLTTQRKIYFVYVGAAPGYHLTYLSSLFPNIQFEVYDINDIIGESHDNLNIHKEKFTTIVANYWKEKVESENAYLAFYSNITKEITKCSNAAKNVILQNNWWTVMNPDLTMFKFRLPWSIGYTLYPIGDIFMQPYTSGTNTESCLIVKKNAKMISYDHEKYERACYYHNTILRNSKWRVQNYDTHILSSDKSSTLDNLNDLDECYDCTLFMMIVKEYQSNNISNLSIKEIEKNVQYGNHNIKSMTINHFNKTIDVFRRSCYVKCGFTYCKVCLSGVPDAIANKSSNSTPNRSISSTPVDSPINSPRIYESGSSRESTPRGTRESSIISLYSNVVNPHNSDDNSSWTTGKDSPRIILTTTNSSPVRVVKNFGSSRWIKKDTK
jgi:hypothetical protein